MRSDIKPLLLKAYHECYIMLSPDVLTNVCSAARRKEIYLIRLTAIQPFSQFLSHAVPGLEHYRLNIYADPH